MSNRRTLRVDSIINPKVKVGDKVRLTNDETLTHVIYDGNFDLLRKYPMIGLDKPLEDIEGVVTHTDVTNFVVERDGKFVTYLQDIIVKLNGQLFRTASGAVKVIKTPVEILTEKIETLKASKSKAKNLSRKIELLEEIREEIINHK